MFDVSVKGLSGTLFVVSVFALENQLPFPRVVTSPKTVTVADSDRGLIMANALKDMKYNMMYNCRDDSTVLH